jgi:hypothetical protein
MTEKPWKLIEADLPEIIPNHNIPSQGGGSPPVEEARNYCKYCIHWRKPRAKVIRSKRLGYCTEKYDYTQENDVCDKFSHKLFGG